MPTMDDKTRKIVEEEFKKLKGPVKIVYFTQEIECGNCRNARETLNSIKELNSLISMEVYDFVLDKEMVQKYQVDKIPATVILSGEEDFGFRYYGVPAGYEFSTLITMIVTASTRETNLTQKVKDDLKKIINELKVQVFVIPTCPHCPRAAIAAGKFALENHNLKVSVVEIGEYPHLVQKYAVMGTPKVVINEMVSFEGALPEPLFVAHLLHAQEHLLEKGGEPVGTA